MRLRISRRLVARVALVDENVDSENPALGSVAIYSHNSKVVHDYANDPLRWTCTLDIGHWRAT